MHSRDFDDVADAAAEIPGWLTRDQARVLFAAAAAVPCDGVVVEIGSHHGRSTLVLAGGVPRSATVVAIDPFLPGWRYGAPDTEQALRSNLATAGLTGIVDVWVATSEAALETWDRPVDLVYIDGKHDYWSVRHDLGWARWVRPDGLVLVHDAFSSVGVTLGLLRTLLGGSTLTYEGRTGSLAAVRVCAPSPHQQLRVLREVPWWVRNLVVKALLRLRARRLARLLGHSGDADPY